MKKICALAEIATIFALCMVRIWLIRENYMVFIILALIAASWTLRKETLRTLGFFPKMKIPRRRIQTAYLATIIALCAIPFFRSYDAVQAGMSAVWSFMFRQYGWALLQEILVCGYFALRLNDIFLNHRRSALATGILFGIGHSPNIFLMAVTLAGGIFLALIFFKRRNIHEVAGLHAAVSAVLYHAVPVYIHHRFIVGPNFFN